MCVNALPSVTLKHCNNEIEKEITKHQCTASLDGSKGSKTNDSLGLLTEHL